MESSGSGSFEGPRGGASGAAREEAARDLDVLIVGAGLSGIAAGYHVSTALPRCSFAILEARGAMGGTWDLFRYPGIRSDSDMFTLGYAFRPWKDAKAIADGPAIRAYIEDTARAYGLDRKIRYHHRVVRCAWSSADARWTIEIEVPGGAGAGAAVRRETLRCRFLLMCSGYYDYDAGYTPELPGLSRFRGRVVHPQAWTDDVVWEGKRVVVIGSGATAVTLVPELAKKAAHVTMLQRSPTYVLSRPGVDPVAERLRRALPPGAAFGLTRWKQIAVSQAWYLFCKRFPDRAAKLVRAGVRAALGADFDVDTHFAPRYRPWDQRMCLVPDGDLFEAIKSGRAEVVTDTIESFVEDGIALGSGRTLGADLVVTATGLKLKILGGAALEVDGEPVDLSKKWNYKGTMFSDVPNLAATFGYTNASWTLKCDLACAFACRLIAHMDARGLRRVVPRYHGDPNASEPIIDFSSGYVQRALPSLPRQGLRAPWRLYQNYLRDLLSLRYAPLEDDALELG